MDGRDIFKIWAPIGAKWVQWVRPVPFVEIDNEFRAYDTGVFNIPNINYISEFSTDTAIIVDLPGSDSVKEGIALARLGYRPIPIYNGTNEQVGSLSTVDNKAIQVALIKGISELQKIEISNNAPPVFLLDSNRMHRFKMNASIFDNSWDIYYQDMPSAEYFLKNNINKIIVRGEKIQKDLQKILYKFQKKGIKILFASGYEEPKSITIKKPLFIKND